MEKYAKPSLTYSQQVDLLKSRGLIDEALEVLEITVRAITSHEMAQKYDPFFHEQASNFYVRFDHATWVAKVHEEATRSRESL